jgi:hypothetical protein
MQGRLGLEWTGTRGHHVVRCLWSPLKSVRKGFFMKPKLLTNHQEGKGPLLGGSEFLEPEKLVSKWKMRSRPPPNGASDSKSLRRH